MKAQQTVSVIIPSYNHKRYIEAAILSVKKQTYEPIELVVVDDGSTDGSVDLLLELRKEFGFQLKCQKNVGVCATLNRGIAEMANGSYIALLASDDLWHPDKIRLQIDALETSPGSELCFSQAMEFKSDKKLLSGSTFPARCMTGNVLNQVFLRQHVPAGTMLFSRGLYDYLGGFDESLTEEDWDFVIRSAAVTEFCAVNTPLLYYRNHGLNTMRVRSRRDIFAEKVKLLKKNSGLVNPLIFATSLSAHFIHDCILHRVAKKA